MTGYDAHTEQEIIVESGQPGMRHARHRKKSTRHKMCVLYFSAVFDRRIIRSNQCSANVQSRCGQRHVQ